MPNHFHGIVTLTISGAPLSQIVSAYKSQSAFHINVLRGTRGMAVWQRGFYDHVVRDDRDHDRIREYIQTNPARWSLDEESPAHASAAMPLGGLKPAPTKDTLVDS